MGSASYSLSWIKSNLPSSFQPDYENEREELLRLRINFSDANYVVTYSLD